MTASIFIAPYGIQTRDTRFRPIRLLVVISIASHCARVPGVCPWHRPDGPIGASGNRPHYPSACHGIKVESVEGHQGASEYHDTDNFYKRPPIEHRPRAVPPMPLGGRTSHMRSCP